MNTSLSKGKYFVFILKVEAISVGFLDFCIPLQPCIVTQDIRVSAYTLAIKVQNSEALKTAGSWKCNISLAIFKDSWQRDFNTIQCHTLEEKLKLVENTTTAKCSYLIQLISKIITEMAWPQQIRFFSCSPVQNQHQTFSISVSISDISQISASVTNFKNKNFKLFNYNTSFLEATFHWFLCFFLSLFCLGVFLSLDGSLFSLINNTLANWKLLLFSIICVI